MYLSDTELRSRLSDLAIECPNPDHPFIVDYQVGPCSIDLRLSDVFWAPLRGTHIDLRKSALLELQPRRYYRQSRLDKDEFITLKPGKMLIGRIYEKFTVPPDCAAKIEGRSSFGRMGVSVHFSGDFANPGYRGHFPLVLYNHSPTPIRLFPFIPICQLLLVPLSSTPIRQYGDGTVQSNYMDDDGGPSYWWRDKRIRGLQRTFRGVGLNLKVEDRLLNTIGVQEPEIIERFDAYFGRHLHEQHGSADDLLHRFSESEERLRHRQRLWKGFQRLFFAVAASVSIKFAFDSQYHWWHYTTWLITLASLLPCIMATMIPETKYFGRSEHDAHQRKNAEQDGGGQPATRPESK